MYHTVLVPLDGSERAETILPHVQDIAQRYQAKVVFMSVLELPHTVVAPDGIYVPSQAIIEEQQQEIEAYLNKQAKAFRDLGLTVETHVAHGRTVDAICHAAQEFSVDLVALASHGRTGLAQVFYGSVAAGVLHRIDRPLLLVRA
jgi:nucleotide-binding universal stress UspA family protein